MKITDLIPYILLNNAVHLILTFCFTIYLQ